MIDITAFLNEFLQKLNDTFSERVWFAGLQGSYNRGEATDTSDIDLVVILNELSVFDIETYNSMLDTLPHREKICGFLSGKAELLNWDASDLFQFYYDTKPLKGSLDELPPLVNNEAVNRAIKIGACNIYHGCVHNMLYEKSKVILKGLYKSAIFVIIAINFRQTKKYVSKIKELREIVAPDERLILDNFSAIKNDGMTDFKEMSEALFDWSKKWIEQA